MSEAEIIKRPPEDLQSGVLVVVTDDENDRIVVDAEEYQELYKAQEISFPTTNDQIGQVLDEVFPGYVPGVNSIVTANANNTFLNTLGQFGVRP
jgi:hypothetical protein